MKFLLLFIPLLFIQASLSGQSYWFNGMTRVPGKIAKGFDAGVNIGGQSFASNISQITNLATGASYSPTEDQDTDLGFQTLQIGAEVAWLNSYFDLEGGADLSLSGVNSDGADLDELYLGFNFRLGGVVKYDFTPSSDWTITPFLRSGVSFEHVTNDLAIPTTYYTIYGPVTTYNYNVYGSSLSNIFFNWRIGTAVRWKSLVTSIAIGKYNPIGGDLNDVFDTIPSQDPYDPFFLQLNIGYNFSESSTLSLGCRTEWWDNSSIQNFSGVDYKIDYEWEGFALDLTYDSKF
jgi:hypothetical protein